MRKCSVEGCEGDAKWVSGHYMVGPRKVRVWMCEDHYIHVENPLQEVDPPYGVRVALEKDAEYYAEQERKDRHKVIDLDARSVHAFSRTGAGARVPYDRVASFRWGA